MPYEPHEQLIQASKGTLWKFMSMDHFADLIDSGTLHFHRIDDFEDVFEGTYPEANKKLRPKIYEGDIILPQAIYDQIEVHARTSLYACCFHRSKYETAFMWKQYGNDGVAIKTTVPRLKKSFGPASEKVYVSPVTYIDYKTKFLPEPNLMNLAFYKRRSFEAEKELRALICSEEPGVGRQVKVELSALLYEVYAAPGKEGVAKATKALLDSRGIKGVKVKVSDLYKVTK